MAGFIFEEGQEVQTGFHGQHDFVYAEGVEVPDTGKSTLVFEQGTGLGGKGIYVGGDIGAYETSNTHTDFYDYGSGNPFHARGLNNAGVHVKDPQKTMYWGLHYSTASSTYALFAWYPGDSSGDNDQYEVEMTYNGLQDHITHAAGSPIVEDDEDAPDNGDNYGTNADGAPVAANYWTWVPADGHMYELSEVGFSIPVDVADNPDSTANPDPEVAPAEMVGVGPNGTNSIGWIGFGEQFSLEVRTP